jgi:hypothetical protein
MKATYRITVTLPLRQGTRESLRLAMLKSLATRGEDRAVLRSVKVKREVPRASRA